MHAYIKKWFSDSQGKHTPTTERHPDSVISYTIFLGQSCDYLHFTWDVSTS